MADESQDSGRAFLVGLLLTTLVLGMIVLVVKSDYRFESNALSNEDYYPTITVGTSEE